ncbi:IS66 family transposase [Sulfobacillus thermosulfidooxidans]|uniref:IS66 family transposase n=1 Tax=Sulfobacillus thermosulfidooxidans TaxID=28034 RepID=UPI003D6C9052
MIAQVQQVNACRHGERETLTTPIKTAPIPKPVYPVSLALASLLAFTLHQKFTEHLPLYRLEQEWARQTWVIYAPQTELRPIYCARMKAP